MNPIRKQIHTISIYFAKQYEEPSGTNYTENVEKILFYDVEKIDTECVQCKICNENIKLYARVAVFIEFLEIQNAYGCIDVTALTATLTVL